MRQMNTKVVPVLWASCQQSVGNTRRLTAGHSCLSVSGKQMPTGHEPTETFVGVLALCRKACERCRPFFGLFHVKQTHPLLSFSCFAPDAENADNQDDICLLTADAIFAASLTLDCCQKR